MRDKSSFSLSVRVGSVGPAWPGNSLDCMVLTSLGGEIKVSQKLEFVLPSGFVFFFQCGFLGKL